MTRSGVPRKAKTAFEADPAGVADMTALCQSLCAGCQGFACDDDSAALLQR